MNRLFAVLLSLPLIIIGISCSSKAGNDAKADEALIPPMPGDSAAGEKPPIPELTLNDLDGKAFTLRSLGENPVLMFFDPDCDHCQRECKAIRARQDEFRPYPLHLVSIESSDSIKKFRDEYDLRDPLFHFATGDLKAILTAVGEIQSVPCFFIYRAGKLHKRLEGEVEMDELLDALK